MPQPNDPVEPTEQRPAPAGPAQGPAPTQPLPPASAATPPPGAPPGPPPLAGSSQPPAGPPPRQPGLWRQATSSTGGLIAVIVAACLAALVLLGLVASGIFVATRVVADHHPEMRIDRRGGDSAIVPPGQLKRLERGMPKAQVPRQPRGDLDSILRGAMGLGRVQHGEFTVQGADGKATVMTLQTGSVTKVSATSITVKSPDGFTATYAIDSSTRGRTTGLAADDTVLVIAQKEGAKAVVIRATRTS